MREEGVTYRKASQEASKTVQVSGDSEHTGHEEEGAGSETEANTRFWLAQLEGAAS